MERQSNISVWQLRLFEGFDSDVMVMQRDEEEVYDGALHVFFDKEYYDAYVLKATKYGVHRYAYHEDKLGEVVNQIFEENINGLVIHISTNPETKNILEDEKYISAKDLMVIKDAAVSYHYLYTTSIERCDRLDAIANLWTKYVYVIGQLPDPRVKPKEGEKLVFELMTVKRKNDGTPSSADDYDYESLKVFLTYDSAMRFNPDKKPVNKYRLSVLSQFVKGKIRIIIEPHRNYWLEFDPANIDLKGHLELPVFNEDTVKERIASYKERNKAYVILSPNHSDYRQKLGNPLLVKANEKNVIIHIFEEYEDAQEYVIQNPNILPVLDGIYPIGEIDNLEEIVVIADKLGVNVLNLDTDTLKAVGCRIDYFMQNAGYTRRLEEFLDVDEIGKVMRIEDGKTQYRMPLIKFCDQTNDYEVSELRRAEVIAHIDTDLDNGLSFIAGCSVVEMIIMVREVATRFDNARKENNDEEKVKYNRLMNLFTIPLTEALCEKAYIYALRDANGEFVLKNNIPYLLLTNRYEAGRKGEGRLVPASIDNAGFMEKLVNASSVVAITDGPSYLCLLDTKLMRDVAAAWKKSDPIREEFMIYMTQGANISYPEARYYYKRLKSDSSIFAEFTATVRNGDYPEVGMLNIEGHTAGELAQKNGYSVLEAYDALLSIKVGKNTQADDDSSDELTEEKKGLFGKIFKK